MKNLNRLIWLGASCALLAGCVPMLVATGTATAVTVAMDRRTTGTVVSDTVLESRVSLAISQEYGDKVKSHITVTSYNGRVLLSGEVETNEAKKAAYRIAKMSLDVDEVINELLVGENVGTIQRLSDTYLKKKVQAMLIGTQNIPSVQIKVTVDRGIVYLLGMLTKEENVAACQVASKTSGVAKVISFVELLTPEQIKQRRLIDEKKQKENQKREKEYAHPDGA